MKWHLTSFLASLLRLGLITEQNNFEFASLDLDFLPSLPGGDLKLSSISLYTVVCSRGGGRYCQSTSLDSFTLSNLILLGPERKSECTHKKVI